MRFLLALCFFLGGAAQAQVAARAPDVIYVPTPQNLVDEMMRLANVHAGDVLYDLGCGDGRIPITAAMRWGVRGYCIDIDPQRIAEANANVKKYRVANLVTVRQEDLFTTRFGDATVVTLYLLPELNLKLRPRILSELKPGTRIVSHQFDMGDWQPDRRIELEGRTIYLWTVPKR